MKALCFDCDQIKRGCKIVNKIINPNWQDVLGKPVCKACLNTQRGIGICFDVVDLKPDI